MKTLQSIAFISLMLLVNPCSACAQAAKAPETVPDSVLKFASELRPRVTENLDVGEWLAKEELVAVMKNYKRAPRSWQLDPAVAAEMEGFDLYEFVTSRARYTLVCGCDLLSQYPLEQITEEKLRISNVRAKYWAEPSAGPLQVSTDCAYFVDSAGGVKQLASQSDVAYYFKLRREFNVDSQKRLTASQFWKNDIFLANIEYLRREYDSGVEEVPEFASKSGLAEGSRVYSTQLVNLIGFILHREGQSPKLIFVAPLTW